MLPRHLADLSFRNVNSCQAREFSPLSFKSFPPNKPSRIYSRNVRGTNFLLQSITGALPLYCCRLSALLLTSTAGDLKKFCLVTSSKKITRSRVSSHECHTLAIYISDDHRQYVTTFIRTVGISTKFERACEKFTARLCKIIPKLHKFPTASRGAVNSCHLYAIICGAIYEFFCHIYGSRQISRQVSLIMPKTNNRLDSE